MRHLFIPYKLAVIAKEKGFNEPCFTYFKNGELTANISWGRWINENLSNFNNENIATPTYQQIIDWFREKEIHIIEKPAFGWNVMIEYDGGYITHRELFTIDEAIEEAFKLI